MKYILTESQLSKLIKGKIKEAPNMSDKIIKNLVNIMTLLCRVTSKRRQTIVVFKVC